MHDKNYSGYGFIEKTTKMDTDCNRIIRATNLFRPFCLEVPVLKIS